MGLNGICSAGWFQDHVHHGWNQYHGVVTSYFLGTVLIVVLFSLIFQIHQNGWQRIQQNLKQGTSEGWISGGDGCPWLSQIFTCLLAKALMASVPLCWYRMLVRCFQGCWLEQDTQPSAVSMEDGDRVFLWSQGHAAGPSWQMGAP